MKTLDILSNGVTKTSLKETCKELINNENPLQTYVEIKAMQVILDEAISDKDFRARVKEDFLKQGEGALSRRDFYGATLKVISQEKKNTLAKVYEYSAEVKDIENEIVLLEIRLKQKKELLKVTKLLEINGGTAKEVRFNGVPMKETDVLDTFNLSVTFNN